MRKRWILYLVLSLLMGRAWGLHLPSMMGQDAPCHGQTVHTLHVAAQGQDDELAASVDPSSAAPTPASSAPADGMQGDGHVCCLMLVDAQAWRWPAGLVPTPDRSEPRWASASRDLDLRPPIQAL
jgi:hypothetical protein